MIELLVVLAILSVFAIILVPNIINEPDKGKIVKAKLDIKTISQALEMYRLDNNIYPDTSQGLIALVKKPNVPPLPKNWKKNGYLSGKKLPIDPWGNNYIYLSPADVNDPDTNEALAYEIISYGSDNSRGGEETAADIRYTEIN